MYNSDLQDALHDAEDVVGLAGLVDLQPAEIIIVRITIIMIIVILSHNNNNNHTDNHNNTTNEPIN